MIFKCVDGVYEGTSQELFFFIFINNFRISSLKLNEETIISITFKAPLKE